jgi:GNAT superfamily N-acetyltransferase
MHGARDVKAGPGNRPDTSGQGGPVLRRADVSDAGAIAAFHTAVWREAYRGVVPDTYLDGVDEVQRTARWSTRLRSGARSVVVAAVGTRLVGVVSVARKADREFPDLPPTPPLELKSLYLDAAWRGSGLADRLLLAGIGDAPAFLWVFDANQRAKAFYRRHSFVPDGAAKVDPDTMVEEIRMRR